MTRSLSDSVFHHMDIYRYVRISISLYRCVCMYKSTSDAIAIGFSPSFYRYIHIWFSLSLYRYLHICTNLYFIIQMYMYLQIYQWCDRNRILSFIIQIYIDMYESLFRYTDVYVSKNLPVIRLQSDSLFHYIDIYTYVRISISLYRCICMYESISLIPSQLDTCSPRYIAIGFSLSSVCRLERQWYI